MQAQGYVPRCNEEWSFGDRSSASAWVPASCELLMSSFCLLWSFREGIEGRGNSVRARCVVRGLSGVDQHAPRWRLPGLEKTGIEDEATVTMV